MKSENANAIQQKMLDFEKQNVTQILEGRRVNPVAKTFHKLGIIVPYDTETDVGYRPLSESESML